MEPLLKCSRHPSGQDTTPSQRLCLPGRIRPCAFFSVDARRADATGIASVAPIKESVLGGALVLHTSSLRPDGLSFTARRAAPHALQLSSAIVFARGTREVADAIAGRYRRAQARELYELSNEPKRKEFLDDLFSFMQKRGKFHHYRFEKRRLASHLAAIVARRKPLLADRGELDSQSRILKMGTCEEVRMSSRAKETLKSSRTTVSMPPFSVIK
ncbi:hypothetical protein HPB51_014612 [Rhipicephalus microplus]|uniref:Uncharacterized protein n=1 Tax=Rhipicephalus microplus TaxID=6941 RepID=A0A9J6F3S5_RHIMP|nr:hypothetical protein HPB51_014612 [Rhipicephalus microplus]